MHHERMSPDYDPPPPPAYDHKVADSDDIVLHSKRGSFAYMYDGQNEPGSDNTSEVGKTQV